jgi:hypothetical protein
MIGQKKAGTRSPSPGDELPTPPACSFPLSPGATTPPGTALPEEVGAAAAGVTTAVATGPGAAGFVVGGAAVGAAVTTGAAVGLGLGTGLGLGLGTGLGLGLGCGPVTVIVGPLRFGELPFVATATKVTVQVPAGRVELPSYVPFVALPEVRLSEMEREPTTAITVVAGWSPMYRTPNTKVVVVVPLLGETLGLLS